MIKPDKLRELLTKTIPYFAKNPEQLQIYYA
ncbi:phage tail protein, partial [Glaesserella parasuis]|nr:phage tail protein [Glaesserella parasuis]MDP0267335.1 phage tail protein [Glaesserella parasuis]